MSDLRDINLNRLVVFAAVVEAGSLSAAAQRLGLAKTMVSTHIQRLEAEVGATLIVRTTRRSSLTDAGRTLYEASRACVQTASDALAAISARTCSEAASPGSNAASRKNFSEKPPCSSRPARK